MQGAIAIRAASRRVGRAAGSGKNRHRRWTGSISAAAVPAVMQNAWYAADSPARCGGQGSLYRRRTALMASLIADTLSLTKIGRGPAFTALLASAGVWSQDSVARKNEIAKAFTQTATPSGRVSLIK